HVERICVIECEHALAAVSECADENSFPGACYVYFSYRLFPIDVISGLVLMTGGVTAQLGCDIRVRHEIVHIYAILGIEPVQHSVVSAHVEHRCATVLRTRMSRIAARSGRFGGTIIFLVGWSPYIYGLRVYEAPQQIYRLALGGIVIRCGAPFLQFRF